ncbi:MAG: NAD(P)/FAD-dependent oxidoreductase [Pyrinomonadaceae bacterium]
MILKFDVVIIGGGAAGLFCAIEAGRLGRKVLVIERNSQVGRKIIISGGGRCNFTNIHTSSDNFVSKNPHFCKSALARYTPDDFLRLVKKHRIDFYEKKLGQLFCRESSRQIVDMLVSECGRARAEIRTGCSVSKIERRDLFYLETSAGPVSCTSLVVATGGLSFPKVGATDFGYGVAKQFGLKLESTRPALVPLIFDKADSSRKLAGVSVDSLVAAHSSSFRENILFTHRGLSGPAILQISNYWNRSDSVSVNLMPETNLAKLFEQERLSRQTLTNFLSQFIPARLAETFVPSELGKTPVNEIGQKELFGIAAKLNNWKVKFRDTEGYDKAEVTAGGVSTDELSSKTMEAKKAPGLFFIGEVVDVTGWLGGYNFQWAWASAHAAGKAV